MELFDPQIYVARRKSLMQNVNQGLIWILGNELSPKNYTDNTYHFRQDSNFLYYGGIDLPGLSLLMDTSSGSVFLCGQEYTINDTIWTGPQPSLDELGESIGVTRVLSLEALKTKLKDSATSSIHYLPPYRGLSQIKVSTWLNIPLIDVVEKASNILISAVIDQRSIKEEIELEQIEKALGISHDMHLAVMYDTRPDMKESDMVAALMKVCYQHDVDTAYPVILSVRGETLHNHHHGNMMKDGDLLLGDFGAESPMYYASDITRTIPVSGQFTSPQRDIYSLVLLALQTAVDALGPGKAYRDIHLQAARIMANGLKDMGIMKGNVEEAVLAGAHALFFPHGLGHMLGLDVHDMEDLGENHVGYGDGTSRSSQFGLNALRLGRELKEGFVLTVEPGLYFIPALIDQWKASDKFTEFINYSAIEPFRTMGGIRIEDNYVITKKGSRLLGPPIAKTIDEVEFLRSLDKYIA